MLDLLASNRWLSRQRARILARSMSMLLRLRMLKLARMVCYSRTSSFLVVPEFVHEFCPTTKINDLQISPDTLDRTAHLKELAFNFVRSRMTQGASALVLLLVVILSRFPLLVAWRIVVRHSSSCFLFLHSSTTTSWWEIDIFTATSRYFPDATPSALDHFFRPIKKEALRLRAEGSSGGTLQPILAAISFCPPSTVTHHLINSC